jgi:hypothetical protein
MVLVELKVISNISPLLWGSSNEMLIKIRIDAFDFVAVLTGLGLRFCIGIGGAEGTGMVWSSD